MNPSCRTVDCPFLVSGSNGDHLHRVGAGASHLTSASAYSAPALHVARCRDASTACLEPIGRSIAPVARENVPSVSGPAHLSAICCSSGTSVQGWLPGRDPRLLFLRLGKSCSVGILAHMGKIGMTNRCRWSQLPHPNHLRLRLRSTLLRRCRSDSDSDSDSDSYTMTSARDSSRLRHLRHALKGRRPWPSRLIPATNAQH